MQKKTITKNNQKIKYINLQVHKSTDTRPGWMNAKRQSAQKKYKKNTKKHTEKNTRSTWMDVCEEAIF